MLIFKEMFDLLTTIFFYDYYQLPKPKPKSIANLEINIDDDDVNDTPYLDTVNSQKSLDSTISTQYMPEQTDDYDDDMDMDGFINDESLDDQYSGSSDVNIYLNLTKKKNQHILIFF